VLLGRTAKLKFRDPMSFATILSGVIVVSLLEGSIYYDMPVGDWQNRIGGISMFISFMAFMAFDVLMLWPKERQVYLRDQRAGMYCSSSFYTARTLAEVPTHMLTGILGGIITYYMYGLACGVLMFGVVSGLCILTSAAIFMAVSAVSKNFEQSNQLVMPILTVLFLFSGFFVPANKIPAMWKWVPDVNFIYYSVNYVVVTEVEAMGTCDAADGSNATVVCDDAMVASGFDPTMPFSEVIMCHVYTNIIFRVIAYWALRFCWTGQSCSQRCSA
jgi:ATP-binding cassette subfamily G (WHITE) protein 2